METLGVVLQHDQKYKFLGKLDFFLFDNLSSLDLVCILAIVGTFECLGLLWDLAIVSVVAIDVTRKRKGYGGRKKHKFFSLGIA
jgi:hypothetical protein